MERLQVLLELVAGQYKREAKEAAAATTGISTSAKTAGTATTGMTSSLKGANATIGQFKGLIAGAAVGAVVAFGKSTVAAASNLEESMNAVNVVYEQAAEGVHALGEESVTSFGLSQRAFNEFSVRFSAFAQNIAGSSGRQVVEVVEEMTTRVADFASVHNLSMEEAAVVAQSTLAGETEAFRRFGGDVSAAAVQMKGLEMGLGATSAELTEQEKVLIRYELFMEQTAKTAGDFANTSDSLANSQRMLSANFEDFQAMLGQLVVPAVADTVDTFSDLLTVVNALGSALSGDSEGGIWSDFTAGIGRTLDNLGPLAVAIQIGTDWLDVLAANTDKATGAAGDFDVAVGTGAATLEHYNEIAAGTPFIIQGGTEALDRYNQMAEDSGVANRDVALSLDEQVAAMQRHQEALRAQTDPLFALLTATRNQAEAQAEVTRLQNENKTNTPEYVDALADLTIAGFDLRDAQAAARVQTNLTKDAFIDQAVNAGVARSEAKLLADQLYGLSGLVLDPIRLNIEIRELRRSAGDRAGGVTEHAQHGAASTTGGPYWVGESGPEIVIPPAGSRIIDNRASMQMMGSLGGLGAGGVHIGAVYAMGTPAKIAHDVGLQVALELRMA